MKILGISAGRPMGNSEILAKLALKGAEAAGCEVEFIRLQDYHVAPCTGCEVCMSRKVMNGQDTICSIPESADQYSRYVELTMEADGFIIAAPCYNLTVAGRLLDALNRQHRCLSQVKRRCAEKAKYAATIGVAGTDWSNYLMPILNFAATEHCGSKMHLVDQLLVEQNPAPGTVILDETVTARAYKLGQNLAEVMARDPGLDCYVGDAEEVCPICHGDHLQLRKGRLICPACDISAHVGEDADGTVHVTWDEGYEKCRWSEYGDERHLSGIRAGHGRRMANQERIRELTRDLAGYLPPIKP